MYRNTFWREQVYGTNPPTTERQPEANQHDHLMVFMERLNISCPAIHITEDKEGRRLGLIHPAAKCMALLFHRMREQGKKKGTVTADWMKRWGLQEQAENPPYAGRTPTTLAYLHQYDIESAYLAPRGRHETTQAYKKHLYMTIHSFMRAMAGELEMRVTKKWPHIKWTSVCECSTST